MKQFTSDPSGAGCAARASRSGVSVTVTFRGSEAWHDNALGVYAVAADGTIGDVKIVFDSAHDTLPGHSVSVFLANGESIAAFVISNGYNENKGFEGIDLDVRGALQFISGFGMDAERPANIADNAADVALVWRNGARSAMIQGDIYHSIPALNADGRNHVTEAVSANGDIRLCFKKLPGIGEEDFNDAAITLSTHAPVMGPSGR